MATTKDGDAVGRGLGAQIRAVLIELLPGTLRSLVEKRLLRALSLLLLLLVVAPLLASWLAAFWLKQFARIERPWAQAVLASYRELINEGYSIEAVASRSNARLDYVQFFSFDLPVRKLVRHELRISLHRDQKAALDFHAIALEPDGPGCSLTEDDIELVEIWLEDQPVRTLTQEANRTLEIGESWWRLHRAGFESEGRTQRLAFALTEAARRQPCGRVHVEGSFLVFKDLLPSAKEPQ